MAVITTLNDYMNIVLTKVLENQNLCKYLYYDNDEPLLEPDIIDTSVLAKKESSDRRIFTVPFNSDLQFEQKSTMHILLSEARPTGSSYYKNIVIRFIVLCDNNLWELYTDDGTVNLRPNSILYELSSMFLMKKSIGLGNINEHKIKNIYYNEAVSGYEFTLENYDFSYNN